MPKTARHLSLNLGMQTVSLAEFEMLPGGGLRLTGFAKSELIIDPVADATRPLQIETVAKELREALKAKPGAVVNACLPSQAVFSRFLKLPGATPDDVESIMGFEAQQNVPFPIDEVVWDHQIMGERRNDSWDVALVAIKADQLDEVVGAARRGGLAAHNVDVAPMALYNAFRYNYPEITDPTLLVDLGARTTNLVFCENGRVFCRSIPIGGNSISSAIAKEFEQDITLAEKLKLEKGSVGLGGAYADPEDPTEARIAKVVRNTMTRLHAEIARSINFYRSSQGGTTPMRVFLCGGSTGLAYMAEFFGEKLQARIEFFNPLRNVLVAEEALPEGTTPCASGLAELVGCALRRIGDCPMEISLTPPSIVRARALARRVPRLALAAALLAATPLLWWFHSSRSAELLAQSASTVDAKIQSLQSSATTIDKFERQKKDLETQVAPFLVSAAERSVWADILTELSNRIPKRFIWVTRLTPVSKPGEAATKAITHLELNGLYLDTPENSKGAGIIDEFHDNFTESAIFDIGSDRAAVITERTTPTGETWAYGFTLSLPLKNPIPLP
jgi:type IV pilus assembly protein PilM